MADVAAEVPGSPETRLHPAAVRGVAAGNGGSFELGTDGPKVVLVGVDESTTSARAAWYAAGLARRAGARLITVYVAPIASMAATAPGGAEIVAAEAAAHDLSAEQLRGQAENAARELGIPITFIEAHGDPYSEIRRIADERHADALVVGTSGKSGHRMVGSLAVRLVRAGRWPVTVVP